MSTFSADSLREKLKGLTNTLLGIQSLSQWILFHRRRHSEIVQAWTSEFNNASAGHKLTLIFLANDVIQNSKKKGNEFEASFAPHIAKAVGETYAAGDASVRRSLERTVRVWGERGILVNELPAINEAISKKSSASSSANAKEPSYNPKIIVTPLVQKMNDILAVETASANLNEKVIKINSKLLSGEIIDSAKDQNELSDMAVELDESIKLIEKLRDTLQDETTKRAAFIATLTAEVENQRKAILMAGAKVEDAKKTLIKTESLKKQMRSLYERLPLSVEDPAKKARTTPSPPPIDVPSPRSPSYDNPEPTQNATMTSQNATSQQQQQQQQQLHAPMYGYPPAVLPDLPYDFASSAGFFSEPLNPLAQQQNDHQLFPPPPFF
eukprot:TRINITY_DN739_c0_g1_i1.p1 TRINITY_DN739_c0_g1~~TRINITY_DN739_c0_g1_i1.p1  ORF type:complete len:382 (-),score=120.25 TRINITY_DN739_c0_g1_i1:144-1289(-)